jgi:hypothetical protein
MPDDLTPDFGDADFGDAFDALPDLDVSLGAPVHAALAARKARLAEALVSGETGVQYEALALFAEPLFALYDLDPAQAFGLRASAADADEETVALLETARVLWAYFAIPPAERAHRRPALAAQLVGDEPTDDDWVSLDALLDAAIIHWQALLPEEIDAAQATGHPVLDFDALLAHPIFQIGDEGDREPAGFGPDALSDVEARARFAQDLLDTVGDDPDLFEEAIARADAYWTLAHSDDPEADLRAYARQQADPAATIGEGRRMLARYRELFG